MELTLSELEVALVLEVFSSALSDLRMEICGTDLPAYKRELRHRRLELEAVQARLAAAAGDLSSVAR